MKPTIGQNNKTTKAKTSVSAKGTIVSTSAAPVAAKPAAKRTQAAKPAVSAPAPAAKPVVPAVVAPVAAKPAAPAPAIVAPVAAKPTAPAPVAAKPVAPAPAPLPVQKPVAPVVPAKVELPPTVVTAKIDVGYGNTLFIRGQGDGLSWETGTPLTCVDASTWVWSSQRAKGKVVFKLLVNDRVWAQGEDLSVDAGQRAEVAPAF